MDDIVPALWGTVSVTALLTFIVLYPFYIKKYKRHKYKGIVKGMGESLGSPARAIIYPIGFLIGYLICIILNI
ncbi:MAG: hypothetical protein C5S48_08660 [Candidatus Methanogaster sp.]|nr:MAG: hypothetical protein C5S48_08660 [ANME-2 cluster archaeon]